MPERDKNAINRDRYAENRCRAAVLKRAREMARSGQYAGSECIIAELKSMSGFESARAWLKETELRTQLDHLCDVARVQSAQRAQKCGGDQQEGSEGGA